MRRRIVALALLTAVLATVLFGTPFAAGVFRYYEVAERMELERVADEVAADIPIAAVQRRDPWELPATPAGTQVAVYDTAGGMVQGTGPEPADTAVRNSLRDNEAAYSATAATVVCVIPLTSKDHVLGAVRVERPNARVYYHAFVTWLLMLGCAVLAVGVTWLVALRLVRHLAQPLEHVSAEAFRLGEGDFSVRCEPSGIPEIDALGQCLNHTATRLADMLERERAFSANASHQLRTPLTGLRLSLETALEDRHVNHTGALRRALSAVDVLENTVQDLLVVARDTHRPSQPLEVEPLINDLLVRWREGRATTGRSLRTTIEPDVPTAHASPSAVRQILTVLIDNALIHGTGAVTVTVRDASGSLAIEVTDQGSSAELDEQQIFQRRVDNGAGHGIGLALARSLAQTEGGQLELTCRAPTSFTLFLPARCVSVPGQVR